MASIPEGGLALDVGVGTGDLAMVLSARGVTVVGLDFSQEMLSLGRGKALANGTHPAQHLVLGDAMVLPFRDDTFDSVTSAFTVRNLPSARSAFVEMARVTRTGGKVVCLDFVRPTNTALRPLYFLYLEWAVPVIARIVGGEARAYRYLSRSIRAFLTAEGLKAMMAEAALSDVRYHLMHWGTVAVHIGIKRGD